jgi:hypothetical protein
MQILDIVLYGDGERIRRIPLRPGRLNIITGASKTGKSSLIHIVEYCLGRGTCNVSAGVITDNTRWYALRLLLPSKQVFIARRAPEYGKKSSSQVFVRVGAEVEVPSHEELSGQATSESLTPLLSELLGISPNLNIPPDGQTRDPLEANVRHGFLLTFQEQSEVANPTLLFHRQGEPGRLNAIKDALPYFLGAVAEDRFAKMNELREAKRILATAEKRLKEAESLRGAGSGLSLGLELWASASEQGLIASGTTPRTLEELVSALRPALDWVPSEAPPIPGDAMGRLESERSRLAAEMRAIQDQIRSAHECYAGQKGFQFEAREQRARLSFVNLYAAPSDADESICPICESRLESPTPTVNDLQRSLARVNQQLETVTREEPRLREFIDKAQQNLTDVKQRLSDVRAQLSALMRQQPDVGEQLQSNARLGRLVGSIDLYLRGVTATAENSDKEAAVNQARRRVEVLQQALDDTNAEEMLPSILSIIGQRIGEYAKSLELEYRDDPIRFDLKNLEVVADTAQGPVPLRRMGSGANWVGYHLAAHFALHHWFVQKDRPVPRFLFLDQPSQVYYPQDRDAEGSLDVLEEDDREAVKRMFRWMLDAMEGFQSKFQVIVIDHADLDEEWFQESIVVGMDGQPERWRRGRKLIPLSWLNEETPEPLEVEPVQPTLPF